MIGDKLLKRVLNFDDAEYVHIEFGLNPEWYQSNEIGLDTLMYNANKLVDLNNEAYFKLNKNIINSYIG